MTDSELQRVIQYVTAQLSYGVPITSAVLHAGFCELQELAKTSRTALERDSILAYVCAYTVKKTGQPEPMVREILEAAGRWLDQLCQDLAQQNETVD
jgi:hypothetical protein